MVETNKIFPLSASSGIKKDGTQTEGNFWNNGQWSRFYRGLPRSILGYRSMTQAYPGPSRGLFVNLNGTGYLDIFSGSANNLTVGQFTTGGFGSGVTDITPSGFVSDPNNVWQLDSFFNQNGGGEASLIAHAAPNIANIGSDIMTQVYYGDISSVAPLTGAINDLSQPFEVSGGILALNPYVIAYGSLGLVAWSNLNDPTTFPVANAANPVPDKIVKGLSIRGGSSSPSCLLWSLSSIIQMSFVGGDVVWNFEIMSDQSSILSSSGPVEMDGIYYWPGVDRFLTFNGVLRELPNEMNLDFFYSNLNFSERQKVFGFKIPRWGEIWFCAPLFGATECNWAVVYNVRENTWWDTPLPTDGRSAAFFAQSWQYPVLSGALPYQGGINIWQSEFGYDEIVGNNVNAIPSFIESPSASIVGGNLSFFSSPKVVADNVWTQLVYWEADFNIGPSLNVQVVGRNFAMDTDTVLDNRVITQSNNNYDIQSQARYLRWIIGSNTQGGFYEMGVPLITYRNGDRNPT